MYCDRSAYYQKAIKATARQLQNLLELAVAFFAFWANSLYMIKNTISIKINAWFSV